MSKDTVVGFIGLGVMGRPMAINLIKAGYPLVVYDINPTPMHELVQLGARPAGCAREVAEQAKTIITMLPDSPQVREVILGRDGVLEGARPGALIIEMSSIDPLVTQEIAKSVAEKSIRMLDAPVSGGQPGAVSGTLSIMVGGDKNDFEECYSLLCKMGRTVTRVGPIGSGNVVKLANQIIVALNIAAVAEAFVLAAKAGVGPEEVFRAIKDGLAGSHVMNAKVPLILERKFDPGFRIELHIKDLANAISMAHNVGVPVPLTSVVMEILQALKVEGCAKMDHGAIVRFYEKLARVELHGTRSALGPGT